MKISHQWLRRYVDHDLAPEALAETLTMAGLEVDGVEHRGGALDGVVVGRVETVREHPNADQLVLCDVDLGQGDPVQIACGAPNVEAGQKAPVATVGTTLMLPDGEERTPVTIEARELRGEASNGMICAEDELGLSDDHSGIMVLDADAPVGQPFTAYLEARDIDAQDTVLDIDLTPNRPDATSHIGVGRDVAALTGTPLERPEVSIPEEGGPAAERVSVDLQDEAGCPRYVALLVEDVSVGESPLWLKRRLMALGLRPRNVIVDITNYVLHECGQPLHAFDFDRIRGDRIVVRSLEEETDFTTLDDAERTLPEGTLVIADAERPVAVAGVMGGANSEVTEQTTDVLIESAYFDPSSIRQTAKALNVQTDSSYRFERGVDRDGQVWAAARAAQLMADLAGGTVVDGMVDAHPAPPSARTVVLRPDRLDDVLGTTIPEAEAKRLLEAIGFDVEAGEDALHCTVPTWRPDVTREVDLIEEVARLHGYDRIPEPSHVRVPNRTPGASASHRLRDDVRELLKGRGVREVYTNSMLRTATAEQFAGGEDSADTSGNGAGASETVVETINPTSQEMAALRPRLLPGVLEVMQHNRNHDRTALRFFEFGHVFRAVDAEANGAAGDTFVPGYAEHEALLIALSGPHAPVHWDAESRNSDIFDLKGLVEAVLAELRVPDVAMTPTPEADASAAHALTVTAGETRLGTLMRLKDEHADAYDLDAPVFVAEFDWDAVVAQAMAQDTQAYAPVSRFPRVDRDLALLADADQPVGPMLETIRAEGKPLLEDATVFDLYEGEGVAEGKKSVAFSLRFGADRTLQDEEVDARMNAIVEALERAHAATLREQ
jgi:phenylalanyl-tRNA synthetase beta chain